MNYFPVLYPRLFCLNTRLLRDWFWARPIAISSPPISVIALLLRSRKFKSMLSLVMTSPKALAASSSTSLFLRDILLIFLFLIIASTTPIAP